MSSDTLVITDAPPRRCRSCQAANPDAAKYCWMCGVPLDVAQPATQRPVAQAQLVEMVDDQQRTDPLALQLAPLLAVPLAAIVIWGLFLYDTMWGWIASPAIIIATLVALVHQFLVRGAARPKTAAGKAGIAGSSVLVGLVAGAGTFMATILVLVIIIIMAIVSVIMAIAEACGLR